MRPYPHAPEKAAQLLAEAGYPNGFKLTAVVLPQCGGAEGPLATTIKSQFSAAGVALEMMTSAGITEIAMPKMQGQIPQVDLNIGMVPDFLNHIIFHYSLFFYSKGWVSMINDPQFDKMFEQTYSTIDPEKHRMLCHQTERYVKNRAYFVNLFQAKRLYAVKDGVKFEPALNGGLYLETVEMK